MTTNQIQSIGAGLFFLVIFLSGYWLSHSGKPYNAIILTIHKLIAVAAFIILMIIVIRSNRVASLDTLVLLSGVVTGLCFLSLIVTGALLSIDREMPAIVLKLHQITPYLTVLFTVATLCLLQSRIYG